MSTPGFNTHKSAPAQGALLDVLSKMLGFNRSGADETDQKGNERKRQRLSSRGDRELYRRPSSFADLLHFAYYDRVSQTFQYADHGGVICGVLFELRPVDSEGRNIEYLLGIRDRVTNMLNNIPEHDANPWILQVYMQDEPIAALSSEVRDYIADNGLESTFQEVFTQLMEAHLEAVTRKGGLFVDHESGSRWGARYRRVRCVLYRNYVVGDRHSVSPETDCNNVYDRVYGGLKAAGIEARRGQAGDMVEWMRPWLSPNPVGYADGYEQLRQQPYDRRQDDPDYDDTLASHDIAELVLRQAPESSEERDGIWSFGNEVHRVLTIESLKSAPRVGAMTLERDRKERTAVLMDQLPERSIVAITIVIEPREEIAIRVDGTRRASVGSNALSRLTDKDANRALESMADGRRAYPTWMAIFLRADDVEALDKATLQAGTALTAEDLETIDGESDLVALSAYPMNLPMGYKPQEEKRTLRTRLVWDRHLANLLPVYGSGTGTGNSGLFFLNRNGGPIMVDPLNAADRKRVAHGVVLGPTGAGKSAMGNYMIAWWMAVHRPHLYIIDVMDSYGLMGEYLKANGFSVNHIKMNPGADVSLPPFSEAPKLLVDWNGDDKAPEDRDLLSEMELAARYLITGGSQEEEKRVHAADRLAIRHAILLGAEKTVMDGRDQTMVDDVVWGFRQIARGVKLYGRPEPLDQERRPRCGEMADAMEVFCTGASAKYFNRPGEAFPESDVTIVDLDSLVTKGTPSPEFFVVYMGLMNRINDDIVRRRRTGRPTIVLNDEAHIILRNTLTLEYLVNASKMWRRMGAWLWLLTQTVKTDFKDAASAILSQAEFWFVMSLDDDQQEAETIGDLLNLKPDERALLMSARKEPGRFVEGVMLSSRPATLFRNIPPALCMSLAQTEQHEVAARERVREANGMCSHLEAAQIIADQLDAKRWGVI